MRKRRPHVALLVETSKMHGRGILRGVGRYMHLHGSWSTHVDERSLHDPLPGWLDDWQGDGVILRCAHDEAARFLKRRDIPIVQLGEQYLPGAPQVQSPDPPICQLVFEHLREKGLRQFGFVGITGRSWSHSRADAFLGITTRAGFKCEVLELDVQRSGADLDRDQLKRIQKWLKALSKPVGIMCCYDVMALRVIDACRSIGEAVPERIAVAGVDNDDALCDVSDPSLSSVAQDAEKIGFTAAHVLDQIMHGVSLSEHSFLVEPLGLVARGSTDMMAVEDAELAIALQYIRENARRGIAVDDVAKASAISRRSLERKCSKILGRSPNTEIRRVQLEHVKRLLAETNESFDTISMMAGFEYASYLQSLFKKQTGMTMGAYREKAHPPD